MNATDQDLREYIEVFHSTLRETTEQYIPHESRDNIFHFSLVPARLIGYVSTQYGAAIGWVEICVRSDWVTILLRAEGRGGSWMTAGPSHLAGRTRAQLQQRLPVAQLCVVRVGGA